jgi:hypothetical protein
MKNAIRQLCLAFLSARAPAAYTAAVIAQRVNRSGMLDAPATVDQVEDALRGMATREHWVHVEIDPITKEAGWYATDAGVAQWQLDGCPAVG